MKSIDVVNEIHPLLYDRVRLALMVTLINLTRPVEFNVLLEALNLTKGNLSSHTQKLEEAELIQIRKEFVEKKPKTTYVCTELGRNELKKYLLSIEKLLTQTRQ